MGIILVVFPVWIFRKPAFFYTLTLFFQFPDTPQERTAQSTQQRRTNGVIHHQGAQNTDNPAH